MGKFEEYMVDEGFLDCLSHGVKEGWRAYAKKRAQEKKQDEKSDLTQKIMTAEGDELKKLIRQMVEKNLTMDKNGKVKDASDGNNTIQTQATAWLREHVRSQRRREPQKDAQRRSVFAFGS
mgnify:CR=1 FL=1